MVGQVNKQIELLNTESLRDSRNGAGAAIRQADAFMANCEGEEINEETARAQQKALGSTLQSISELSEIARAEKIARFPHFT